MKNLNTVKAISSVLLTAGILGFFYFSTKQMEGPDPDDFKVEITKIEKRDELLAIFGTVENLSDEDWQSVGIQVEFYDEAGQFLDETSGYGGNVPIVRSKSKESFKITEPTILTVIDDYETTKATVSNGYRR
ncbi:hypothetical protein IEN85_10775 [Pelagicoccus sp. NFK12]|uniref:Uncharacterized protein n=1 Tax=Pelagicoccus enzymogenes TaxID=2773457 RepID=A0A927F7N5_9BACT|nr:FxLYD domain-containing protein [Pelagicoccus enzymogenes]MBD5779972.1 hypothetical protein [Pelagicoccus enzymogenes]